MPKSPVSGNWLTLIKCNGKSGPLWTSLKRADELCREKKKINAGVLLQIVLIVKDRLFMHVLKERRLFFIKAPMALHSRSDCETFSFFKLGWSHCLNIICIIPLFPALQLSRPLTVHTELQNPFLFSENKNTLNLLPSRSRTNFPACFNRIVFSLA